jgi:hypothetical protein
MADAIRTVVKINLGGVCYQTDPCQHNVSLEYDDGSKENLGLLCGPEIGPLFDQHGIDPTTWTKHYYRIDFRE